MTPNRCPHCGHDAGPHHYRDAGTLTPEQAETHGYCPYLATRRLGLPPLILRVIEQTLNHHALYLTVEESAELLAYTSGDSNVAIWTGTGDIIPITDLEWHILPELA